MKRTLQGGEDELGNISVRKEPAQPTKNSRGETGAMHAVKTGALTLTVLNTGTQLADEVTARRGVVNRKAEDRTVRHERAEMAIRREVVEEEVRREMRREAEGPLGSWGMPSVSGGWRVKPAAEKRTNNLWMFPSVGGDR
jgi:hypothetical protein